MTFMEYGGPREIADQYSDRDIHLQRVDARSESPNLPAQH
jgi:hypothetical protein